MRVRSLSKREKQELFTRINSEFPSLKLDLSPKTVVVEVKDERNTFYILEGLAAFAKVDDTFLPILIESLNKNVLNNMPSVVVDMGAIPHIANGADVMRPGIVAVEGEFGEGGLVIVRDEKHKKPIAVGKALENSENVKKAERGKVITNLHYVGDKLWRLCTEALSRYLNV
ncbi:MAG: PUA domain-containing protein [Nitrososphaerota archaeon]|nr:RNA-binding protein [Aigarchaeota archaeon]MDW8077060.1 PUA domain-containing protein [Nitrososphaerota archaeon]